MLILKIYCTDNVAYVKIGNESSDPIEVTKGLYAYRYVTDNTMSLVVMIPYNNFL